MSIISTQYSIESIILIFIVFDLQTAKSTCSQFSISIISLNLLSSLQLQTYPKYPENPEIPEIFNFHLLRRLNTKSTFFPPKFPKPQASVNTTFSKTPFFLKNLVGFPSTPAFSYQTPLRCGKLGKFHFYDDLCALFRPFFKTCSGNPTFSRFLSDFTPLFPVSPPFFYL